MALTFENFGRRMYTTVVFSRACSLLGMCPDVCEWVRGMCLQRQEGRCRRKIDTYPLI